MLRKVLSFNKSWNSFMNKIFLRNNIAFYFLILTLSGCAVINNLDGISALKELGNNQREKEIYIEKQEKSFNKLKEDVKNNQLRKGMPQGTVLSIYGKPVLCKTISNKERSGEVFLYRHPTDYFSSDKIYLYFDQNKLLDSWNL
jgi:hypothetical protein